MSYSLMMNIFFKVILYKKESTACPQIVHNRSMFYIQQMESRMT